MPYFICCDWTVIKYVVKIVRLFQEDTCLMLDCPNLFDKECCFFIFFSSTYNVLQNQI